VFYLLLLILFPLQNWKIKGQATLRYCGSKVIHNSYNVHENYLTLNSGALQGVESDMGVINNLGLVGIIEILRQDIPLLLVF
jgi:cell shape-determining protein MreC